ncbi:spindle and kinetochore-associated protein 1-like isoform X1 [Centruroides vittatus]|uniref:spindle and kinetochore-associated protein 1-like isoform X1 n=2 Tax=Centruroides vittatus TaxID=120091 RepID=UPI0035101E52
MRVNIMESTTLEELAQSFADKISILKASVSIRNLEMFPSNAIFEASYIVESLKETLHALREKVKEQNEDLECLQEEFRNKVQEFNDRLIYIKENIPSNLPAQKSKISNKTIQRTLGKPKALKENNQPIQKTSGILPTIEHITDEELNSLPKYMKGRLNCDVINNIVDSFNKTIVAKYKLLTTPRCQLGTHDMVKFNNFLSQELNETKGHYFCVDQDLKYFANLTINKTLASVLIILRHCNRIRDIRKNGVIRHVLI